VFDDFPQRINIKHFVLSSFKSFTRRMMQNTLTAISVSDVLGIMTGLNVFQRRCRWSRLMTVRVQDVRRRRQTVLVRQKSMKSCALVGRSTVSVGSRHEIAVEKLGEWRTALRRNVSPSVLTSRDQKDNPRHPVRREFRRQAARMAMKCSRSELLRATRHGSLWSMRSGQKSNHRGRQIPVNISHLEKSPDRARRLVYVERRRTQRTGCRTAG